MNSRRTLFVALLAAFGVSSLDAGWFLSSLAFVLVFFLLQVLIGRRLRKRIEPPMQQVRRQVEAGMLQPALDTLQSMLPLGPWVPLLRSQLYAQMGVLAHHLGKDELAIEYLGKATRRSADAMLLLNPDLTVDADALGPWLAALAADGGVVAPRIRNLSGKLETSLRRRPAVARALVEGVIGGVMPSGGIYAEPFIERAVTPKTVTHNIVDGFKLGEVVEQDAIEGLVRQIECGLQFDLASAKLFHVWLGEKIEIGRASCRERV